MVIYCHNKLRSNIKHNKLLLELMQADTSRLLKVSAYGRFDFFRAIIKNVKTNSRMKNIQVFDRQTKERQELSLICETSLASHYKQGPKEG